MKLKIANNNAASIREFFGITDERYQELAAHNASHIHGYLLKMFYSPAEVNENEENNLLVKCIDGCKTFEEAVFVSLCFAQLLQNLIENTVDQNLHQ